MSKKKEWIGLIAAYIGAVLGLVGIMLYNINIRGGLPPVPRMFATLGSRVLLMIIPIIVMIVSKDKLSDYRRDTLGFIFQFYNLVPNLTVRENIEVCRYLTKDPLDMDELLDTLGLKEHADKFPSQLSGGQQQRCAIARALIKNPKLLLCDEPTGALDSKTSRDILILLEKINEKYGTTMLIVTHNNSIKNMVHRVIFLKDGEIAKQYTNEKRVPARELEDL